MTITLVALRPSKCAPNPRNLAKSGPATATGRRQRVLSDAGFWMIDLEFLLNSSVKIHEFRAVQSRLRGGEAINAPINARSFVLGGNNLDATATLQGAVTLRATQITIRATGVKVGIGMYFGIADRFHMVTEVVSGSGNGYFNSISGDGPWSDDTPWLDAAPSAVDYVVKVFPPMRADFASGTAVKLRDITMLGELDDLSQGDISLDLEVMRHGTVNFTIRESI